ncbi:unnamed protein product [Lupinus luteus]|uniref:Uncharacterized protein n=1 Tax=Lupinus luteus TaxID=3873 RepID=A0AAV1X106_LUPLU
MDAPYGNHRKKSSLHLLLLTGTHPLSKVAKAEASFLDRELAQKHFVQLDWSRDGSCIGGKKADASYYFIFRFAWPLAQRGPFSAPRFTSAFIALREKALPLALTF